MAGGAAVQPNIYVAHVYGTAKEMGFATGSLLKQEILTQYANFFDYLYNMVRARRPAHRVAARLLVLAALRAAVGSCDNAGGTGRLLHSLSATLAAQDC